MKLVLEEALETSWGWGAKLVMYFKDAGLQMAGVFLLPWASINCVKQKRQYLVSWWLAIAYMVLWLFDAPD